MLEQNIEALTVAVLALTAAMAGQTSTVPQAAPAPAPAPQPQAAPAAFAAPVANGMPGGPFPTQQAAPAAAPSFGAPAAPSNPFNNDLGAITKYATDSWTILSGKGKGDIVGQLIQHLCGSGSINDLPVEKYGDFYNELERQKAA